LGVSYPGVIGSGRCKICTVLLRVRLLRRRIFNSLTLFLHRLCRLVVEQSLSTASCCVFHMPDVDALTDWRQIAEKFRFSMLRRRSRNFAHWAHVVHTVVRKNNTPSFLTQMYQIFAVFFSNSFPDTAITTEYKLSDYLKLCYIISLDIYAYFIR